LTEAEARRAAQEIENVLSLAGWNVTGVVPNPELYTGADDGVHIEYGWSVNGNSPVPMRVDAKIPKSR
jgi:hypothetical protein